jgi:hypothetical protein
MTRFTFAAVNTAAVQPVLERLYSAIDSGDLSVWQGFYDALSRLPIGPPGVARDDVLRAAPSVLEYSGLERESIPEIGDDLASLLRRYVVASAPFCLRGSDELRGHFVDWYLGLIKDPVHIAQRDLFERLVWSPSEEIEEPFDFLSREGAESRGAFLSPQEVGDLLAAERASGLFFHVAGAIRSKAAAHARDLELFVAFMTLLVAGNFSGYYFED